MLGAVGAGVSVTAPGGRLRFVTATSERIVAIERVQDELQAGVCVEAFRTGEVAERIVNDELRLPARDVR